MSFELVRTVLKEDAWHIRVVVVTLLDFFCVYFHTLMTEGLVFAFVYFLAFKINMSLG